MEEESREAATAEEIHFEIGNRLRIPTRQRLKRPETEHADECPAEAGAWDQCRAVAVSYAGSQAD